MDGMYYAEDWFDVDLLELDEIPYSPGSNVSDGSLPDEFSSTESCLKVRKHTGPTKRVHQRHAANMRERKRMKTLNDAFEGLRCRVPNCGNDRKLSKVDTLRLAIRYIEHLAEILKVDNNNHGHLEKPSKVVIWPKIQDMTSFTDCSRASLIGHSLSWEDNSIPPWTTTKRISTKLWIPSQCQSFESNFLAQLPEIIDS